MAKCQLVELSINVRSMWNALGEETVLVLIKARLDFLPTEGKTFNDNCAIFEGSFFLNALHTEIY